MTPCSPSSATTLRSKACCPKEYSHPRLDKQRLGQLIDLVGNIALGDEHSRSKDILGRSFEYFLSQFASAEGKKGGQFYTPRSVVRVLVEMLAPYTGRVFDPCCGSGGMFVQSLKFIEAHRTQNGNGGRAKDKISIYGQESNKLGHLVDRVRRDLSDEDIAKIADTYHAWRGDPLTPSPGTPGEGRGEGSSAKYQDIPGFCKSATLEDIRHHGHILTPGRYVGAADVEDDGEPFDEKMKRLTAELREQTDEPAIRDPNLHVVLYAAAHRRCRASCSDLWFG